MGLNITKAVFLDRDGVINAAKVRNGKPYPPDSLEELQYLPGVSEALEALKISGYKLIIVTNQPDVATGKQKKEVVEEMHTHILQHLPIDDIYVCYCVEGPGCDCYKPKPKMILDAAQKWSLDLASSFMIGDRWRDVGAGQAAGCRTIFINYGYDEKQPVKPNYVVSNLAEAGEIILSLNGAKTDMQG